VGSKALPKSIHNQAMTRTIAPLILAATLGSAASQDLKRFVKPSHNPILRADSSFRFKDPRTGSSIAWRKADVFNPAAVVKDGKVWLLFRAEDEPSASLGGRTSRIGIAESRDGIRFRVHPEPVLYPMPDSFAVYDDPGGCEDPRVAVTEEGLYVMLYTSWNRKVPRLSVAHSLDLFHWEKKGPAFRAAHGGRFLDSASKSGSVITRLVDGRAVISKINGRYWMYWGEHIVNLAWSENLTDWHPLLDEDGGLLAVARPRPHRFDSHLTECGPPAVTTDKGIILIFNGRNATDGTGHPAIAPGTYTVGRMVFDPADPSRLLDRSDEPFLVPSLPHEVTGQYKAGTTFAEGLVRFRGRWYLYYGTADSFVGVAVSR
jgi:predicted GH43/DUF377 family glycosyl hydrolase